MKYLNSAIIFLFFNITFSQKILNTDIEEYNQTPTIVEIITKPNIYNNKFISVIGVVDKSGYLFFTQEDYTYSIYRNSFKLDIKNISDEKLKSLDGKHVNVYGLFSKTNQNYCSGYIFEIKNIIDLEDLLFQRKMDEYLQRLNDSK